MILAVTLAAGEPARSAQSDEHGALLTLELRLAETATGIAHRRVVVDGVRVHAPAPGRHKEFARTILASTAAEDAAKDFAKGVRAYIRLWVGILSDIPGLRCVQGNHPLVRVEFGAGDVRTTEAELVDRAAWMYAEVYNQRMFAMIHGPEAPCAHPELRWVDPKPVRDMLKRDVERSESR